MLNYKEREDGYLVIDGKNIPPNTVDYRRAVKEEVEGEATIEAWTGSRRETDAATTASNAAILAALDMGDKAIIRALVAGETSRVATWKAEAEILRAKLV
jgi:hypothetical protein